MKVALIEPYFTGSHKQWATQLQEYSRHEVEIFSLPGRNWKWRMQGGAIELAQMFLESKFEPDVFLYTDMLNIPLFQSLVKKQFSHIKSLLYFHENQLTYPWSKNDEYFDRDKITYGFINYCSALASDKIFFNSKYNMSSFLKNSYDLLKALPDYDGSSNIELIKSRSEILPIGIDFSVFDKNKSSKSDLPVILWNHRMEYDKNPADFFNALFALQEEKIDFKLIVLGKEIKGRPKIFDEAKERLAENIIHFGHVESIEKYIELLWTANIQPITSNQDFFSISAVEGLYCNCYPIFPNRLVFPEHFENENKNKNKNEDRSMNQHLYEDQCQLISILRNVIVNKKYVGIKMNQFVERYSWRNLVARYDDLLNT